MEEAVPQVAAVGADAVADSWMAVEEEEEEGEGAEPQSRREWMSAQERQEGSRRLARRRSADEE